jgi:hypothetical protein
MTTIGDAPLTWCDDVQGGLPTLTVSGALTTASGELLHDATLAVLRRHKDALLIDVSAVVVTDKDALALFTRIMVEALQWPDVLVVVCAPGDEVMHLLGADVLDPRLLFDTVAAGRAAALAQELTVTEDLLPIAGAARRARDVTTDACLRWDEPDLVGTAALIASELVTNAAIHAHTMMTLQVRLRPCHVRIAVFDGSGAHAVARETGSTNPGGRGLHLVDAFSAAWGSTSLSTGKVVWSALARPSLQ